MHDPLGDALKALERSAAPQAYDRSERIYARIDGRGFSRFTRGMERPFDPRMTRAMQTTATAMLENTGAKAAYVQSDEISLVWETSAEGGEHFFGGKPFKMVSVLASLATAHFTKALLNPEIGLGDFLERMPHFDARTVGLPDRVVAAQMIAWRGQDARRNAVSMIAQSRYSHKTLQGVSSAAMRTMLQEDDVDIRDFPEPSVNGALIVNRKVEMPLDEKVRMKIPEQHRPGPDQLVLRRVPQVYAMLHPGQMANLEEVIFEDAYPERRTGSDAPRS